VFSSGLTFETGISIALPDESVPWRAVGENTILFEHFYLGVQSIYRPVKIPLNLFAGVRGYPIGLVYNLLAGEPFIIGLLQARAGFELLMNTKLAIRLTGELPFLFATPSIPAEYMVSGHNTMMSGYNIKFTAIVPTPDF